MVDLTLFYWLAAFMCAVSILNGAYHLNSPWGLPYIAVVFAVMAWYLMEPIEFPEDFQANFSPADADFAFFDIALFFICLSVTTPLFVAVLCKNISAPSVVDGSLSPEKILISMGLLWLLLFTYGTSRMNFDLLGALFPIESRAGAGVNMFSRQAGAGAGGDGFIVSTASYLYNLSLASFGILLVLIRNGRYRLLALALILITWPYVFLQGSRSIALSVTLPGIACFLLFSTKSRFYKAIFAVICFSFLNFAFKAIILYRNIGFDNVNFDDVESAHHLGLAMCSELIYTISFINSGLMNIDFGARYVIEFLNFIPRAIWPDKPLLGIEYTLNRGFGTAGTGITTDIGVVATISTGFLGQAVLSFGPLFAPITAATFAGYWIALLARFKSQGTTLRKVVFLVGLGVTFNLGRDITLLVLWPFVFAYLGVRWLERRQRSKKQSFLDMALRLRLNRQVRAREGRRTGSPYLRSVPEP